MWHSGSVISSVTSQRSQPSGIGSPLHVTR